VREPAIEALRDVEAWCRDIFTTLATGIMLFRIEPERRIADANPAAERFLGYERDELVGRPAVMITLSEELDREEPLLAELVAGQRASYVIEKRYVRKDGQVAWGRAAVSLLRGPDGEPQYSLKAIDDVTPERTARAERHALEDQLRQAQKMEALGRLAGGVAHDFNNLLQVIAGHAQLAECDDPEAAQAHVREVLAAARRASALTEQLLAFSRAQPAEPGLHDLNDVVAGLEATLRSLVGSDVDLVTRLAPEPCLFSCDRTKIEQVLLNLAVNARDAMPNGGRLAIETRREEREGEPHVVLAVTDTGAGMDTATLARAFDPFFTTKDVGKGTGLGLATVHEVVAQCSGSIHVESEPGAGTRFELWFPAAAGVAEPAAPRPAALRPAALRPPPEQGTVLLVDDDDAVRTLAAEYLGTLGYRVATAASGHEAVALFERQPVDVLVTDAVMPHMGGRELYERLAERRPGLPVVYMSGYDPETAAAAEGQPNSVFLQKPYSLGELGDALRTLLTPA
jgi:two-component system cell cycle sensor histidine kinase/response regulator CckA